MMRISSVCQLLLLGVTFAGGARIQAQDSVVIAGSDFLQAPLASVLGDSFALDMRGSYPGLIQLEKGEADIGLFLRGPDYPPTADGYTELAYGYLGIAVVANRSNPLNEISLDRLAGIFGSGEEFDFLQWGDLGLNQWADRGIRGAIIESSNNLITEIYKNLGLQSGSLKSNISRVSSSRQMTDLIRNEEGSIGLMGRVPPGAPVKQLALSRERSDTPLVANEENLHFTNYPLKLDLVLIYREEDREELKEALVALFSEEATQALVESGIFPLPEPVRARTILEIRMAE